MAERPKMEDVIVDGGALGQLAFRWHGDRYSHHWTTSNDQPLLCSVESDGTAPWPTSPPLQQIHEQHFDDGRTVLFGVGMAGRGHWSASITLVPQLKCWIIELACRAPVAAERLCSTYKLTGDWQKISERLISCDAVQIEALSLSSLVLDEQNKTAIIAPSTVPTGSATSQWSFRVRMNS